MLVLCTALWAFSFPVIVALPMVQGSLVPGSSTWFLSSLCVCYRFGAAALVLAIAFLPSFRRLSRSEVIQGIGLGITGAAGSLLQVDGMSYTTASTSAFLTQCYCVLIPLVVILRDRRRPSLAVVAGCALVMAGIAILSGFDWETFHIGRGELETILAAVMFAAYILWLERPRFSRNDAIRFSTVNFAVQFAVMLPLALVTARRPADLIEAYRSAEALGLLAVLVVACTLGGYLIMAHWQKHLTATQAGLVYCLEPVFTAVLVLFLPAWISAATGVDYPNESLGLATLAGGGLIVLANVLIVLAPPAAQAAQGVAHVAQGAQASRAEEGS